MTMRPISVYVGYDPREKVAFYTFCESLIAKSSNLLRITPLALHHFDEYEERHSDGSNEFIYSRFLVPYLSNFDGFSIFFDGDMLIRTDISDLLDLIDPNYAVQVVKHNYKTKFEKKYLGSINENYPRKNWSSVIIFNNSHPKHRVLTPEFIASSTGKFLHRFSWLDDSDIGELPLDWNWLVSEYPANDEAKLWHFTIGTPCFKDFAVQDGSDDWRAVRDEVVSHVETGH